MTPRLHFACFTKCFNGIILLCQCEISVHCLKRSVITYGIQKAYPKDIRKLFRISERVSSDMRASFYTTFRPVARLDF